MSHSPVQSVVGARVTAARKRLGMSREALAYHTGLSWSAIAQIESGRRTNPRAQTLASLAEALGVSTDYILGAPQPGRTLLEHHALLYSGTEDFVATTAPIVTESLATADTTLVVSSRTNVEALREALGGPSPHVRYAEASAWYTSPQAALAAYRDFATAALGEGAHWLRVIGEPVWSGRSRSEVAAWTRYESLANLLFATFPLTLLCPYDRGSLPPQILEHAASTHCCSVVDGDLVANPGYRDPGDFCMH